MMTAFEPVCYRIRIGVTGHRDGIDLERMEQCVRDAIDVQLPKLFSEKTFRQIDQVRKVGITPVAYSILSPLAEGADRAVVKVVLKYPKARLDVVLPLSLADYMTDFDSDESRQEFISLLSICRQPRILDQPSGPEYRAIAYEAVGQYVVDHCDLLLAVWDGKQANGRGGTGDVVEYAKSQRRPIIRIWDDNAAILHSGHGLEISALESINRFNAAVLSEADLRASIEAIREHHFSKQAIAPLKNNPDFESSRVMVNHYLMPYYTRAAVLADQNQMRFIWAGNSIYTFSALAILCVALAVMFGGQAATVGFSLELVLLSLIVFSVYRSRRLHSHQFWMDNRFLAERFRSGSFLAVCGLDPDPIVILPFMGHAQTVNDWTVRVFDEVWNGMPKLSPCSEQQCLIMTKYIRETWIAGQVGYHTAKRQREHDARTRLELIGNIILPVTILAAILHLFPETSRHLAWTDFEWPMWFTNVLTLVALVFPAVAASLAGVHAFREHLRLEKRSANITPQLTKLSSKLLSVRDPLQFAALLRHVDEIMLRESQDWLMLMRYVEIKAS